MDLSGQHIAAWNIHRRELPIIEASHEKATVPVKTAKALERGSKLIQETTLFGSSPTRSSSRKAMKIKVQMKSSTIRA